MNGEQLYNRFREILRTDHAVECDTWGGLDEADRAAWNKLAAECCTR